MFTAYSTSNRGRGDHTYAWTIQAEEGGLSGAGNLAAYVGGGQVGKALVDSKGLCDFFCEDNTSELFLKLYHALTGFEYTTESMKTCGARIYTLERHVNNRLGRKRVYDAYIPPKLTVPMTGGAHMGRAVHPVQYGATSDVVARAQGWTEHRGPDARAPGREALRGNMNDRNISSGMAFLLIAATLVPASCGISLAPTRDAWYTQHYMIMQDFEKTLYAKLSSEGKVELRRLFWAFRDQGARLEFGERLRWVSTAFRRENSRQPGIRTGEPDLPPQRESHHPRS